MGPPGVSPARLCVKYSKIQIGEECMAGRRALANRTIDGAGSLRRRALAPWALQSHVFERVSARSRAAVPASWHQPESRTILRAVARPDQSRLEVTTRLMSRAT